MEKKIELESLLTADDKRLADHLAFFALINLGLIESLANGLISPTEAVVHFYFADNCQGVRKILRDKTADRIMSHGVQLPDLFACLPIEDAQREFLHELAVMKNLCLRLLERGRKVA
jgi:hypothetical protein